MDLRTVANGAAQAVNPNIIVSVQASTGSTLGAGAKQVPTYASPVVGPAQVQALDGSELRQLAKMNIQGNIKAIYLRGSLAGVVRPTSQGGDLVTIAAPAPLQWQGIWLVVKVIESWPYFTKCAIVLQQANGNP